MKDSLLLDDNWDITLTSGGDIATCTGEYAVAQNVANALRLFTNDAFFDAQKGIPYFDIALGQKPVYSVIRAKMRAAALEVEGVATATPNIALDTETNAITGDVEITTTDNDTLSITL